MPELDGLEAAKRIRQQVPADEQPFIVALTANVRAEDRAACLAAGMDAVLSKPIRIRALQDLLSQADSRLRPQVKPSV
jgi:CheY-like chemotaxis protein